VTAFSASSGVGWGQRRMDGREGKAAAPSAVPGTAWANRPVSWRSGQDRDRGDRPFITFIIDVAGRRVLSFRRRQPLSEDACTSSYYFRQFHGVRVPRKCASIHFIFLGKTSSGDLDTWKCSE
jgi:hypothetical protein